MFIFESSLKIVRNDDPGLVERPLSKKKPSKFKLVGQLCNVVYAIMGTVYAIVMIVQAL